MPFLHCFSIGHCNWRNISSSKSVELFQKLKIQSKQKSSIQIWLGTHLKTVRDPCDIARTWRIDHFRQREDFSIKLIGTPISPSSQHPLSIYYANVSKCSSFIISMKILCYYDYFSHYLYWVLLIHINSTDIQDSYHFILHFFKIYLYKHI